MQIKKENQIKLQQRILKTTYSSKRVNSTILKHQNWNFLVTHKAKLNDQTEKILPKLRTHQFTSNINIHKHTSKMNKGGGGKYKQKIMISTQQG